MLFCYVNMIDFCIWFGNMLLECFGRLIQVLNDVNGNFDNFLTRSKIILLHVLFYKKC